MHCLITHLGICSWLNHKRFYNGLSGSSTCVIIFSLKKRRVGAAQVPNRHWYSKYWTHNNVTFENDSLQLLLFVPFDEKRLFPSALSLPSRHVWVGWWIIHHSLNVTFILRQCYIIMIEMMMASESPSLNK